MTSIQGPHRADRRSEAGSAREALAPLGCDTLTPVDVFHQEPTLELLDDAGLAYWELDLRSQIFVWSDQVYAMAGVEPGTPATLSQQYSWAHPDDNSSVTISDSLRIAEGKPWTLTFRFIRPDGDLWNFQAWYRPIMDGQGRPYRTAGFIQDVTPAIVSEPGIAVDSRSR